MAIFIRYPAYSVLLCREHRCAVYSLNKHLERHHNMPAAKRRALLASYEDIALVAPGEVTQLAPYSSSIDELGPAQDAFLCICSSNSSSSSISKGVTNSAVCGFISISCVKMPQHNNQQHQVQLTRWSSPAAASYQQHAAKLWKPIKIHAFFREPRYVRYFLLCTRRASTCCGCPGSSSARTSAISHSRAALSISLQRLPSIQTRCGCVQCQSTRCLARWCTV
jgi:hypothetical protein